MGQQTGMGTFTMGLGRVIAYADLPLGEKCFSGRGICDGCFWNHPGVQGFSGLGRETVMGCSPNRDLGANPLSPTAGLSSDQRRHLSSRVPTPQAPSSPALY